MAYILNVLFKSSFVYKCIELSEPQILSKGWCCFCLWFWWAVVSVLLKQSFRHTGFTLASLVFTKTLVHVLDGASIRFLVAVLAKTLFHRRYVYTLLWLITLPRCCFGIFTEAISIRATRCMLRIWIILLEHFARTALILLKLRVTVMLLQLLSTSAYFFSVLRAANSTRLAERASSCSSSVLRSSTHFIRYHHDSWTFVAETTHVILEMKVLAWAVAAQIAVSVLFVWVPLLGAAELLVHLHELHDWLGEFDVLAAREVPGFSGPLAITSTVRKSERSTFFLPFLLEREVVQLVVVERTHVPLAHLPHLLHLLILLLVGTAHLVHIDMCPIQERVGMSARRLLLAQIAIMLLCWTTVSLLLLEQLLSLLVSQLLAIRILMNCRRKWVRSNTVLGLHSQYFGREDLVVASDSGCISPNISRLMLG